MNNGELITLAVCGWWVTSPFAAMFLGRFVRRGRQ